VALYAIDGTAVGTGTVTGAAAVNAVLGGTLAGGGSVSVPLVPDHNFGGTVVGSALVLGSVQRRMAFSGNPQGVGDLIDGTFLPLAGQAYGSALVQGTLLRRIGVSGYTGGTGRMVWSMPEPIIGIALVTAFVEVIRVPSSCHLQCKAAEFRWMQTLGRGDIGICITDPVGNPIGPVFVSYTLYQVVRGCQLHQVGPERCCPPSSGVGKYYVTGTAGEGGQPGQWLVRWRYRKTFGSPVIEKDFCFQVLDAVLGPIPGDTTQRVCKYGWD
jgi:hypothetical protein